MYSPVWSPSLFPVYLWPLGAGTGGLLCAETGMVHCDNEAKLEAPRRAQRGGMLGQAVEHVQESGRVHAGKDS